MAKALKTIGKIASVAAVVLAFVPGGQPFAAAASAIAGVANAGASLLAQPEPIGGESTNVLIDKSAPTPYVMGRTLTGGALVHDAGYGSDYKKIPNPNRSMVFVYSDCGPVQEIEALYADGASVGSGGEIGGYYDERMHYDKLSGSRPESRALSGNQGTIPDWGSSYKLSGKASGLVTMRWDKNQEVYAAGTPDFAALIKGVRVYSIRDDSTYPGGSGSCRLGDETTYIYSENPADHAITYLYGRYELGERIFGVGKSVDGIDLPAFVEWANVCDANNWKVGGVMYEPADKWNNLKVIMQTGSARPVHNNGQLSVVFDAPKVPLAVFTEDDLANGDITVPSTRTFRNRINSIIPIFRSVSHEWQFISGTAVTVSDYVTEDGEIKRSERKYSLCQDATHGAQLAAYEVVNSRELEGITLPFKPKILPYGSGDAIELNMPNLGLVGTFVIQTRSFNPLNAITTVTVKTETAAKHSFALGASTTVPTAPTLMFGADLDRISYNATGQAAINETQVQTSWTNGIQIDGISASGTATVNVSGHSRVYPDETVTVQSGQLVGLVQDTDYVIYYDDIPREGGAVGYSAIPSSDYLNDPDGGKGRHFVGYIKTPKTDSAANTVGVPPIPPNVVPETVPNALGLGGVVAEEIIQNISTNASSVAALQATYGSTASAAASAASAAAAQSAAESAQSLSEAAQSAAETAAASADSFQSSAAASATSASTSASASETAKNIATAAQTAASGSATAAEQHSSSASISASTASQSTAAGRPSTFESGGEYFVSAPLSDPITGSPADNSSNIVSGSDTDGSYLSNTSSGDAPSILQRLGIPYVPGEKYRVSTRFKVLSGSPSSVIIRGRRINGDYTQSLSAHGLTVPLASTTVDDYVFEFTASQARFDEGTRIVRAEVDINPDENQVLAVYSLNIENITAVAAAEDSATAAASSASAAAASETSAGQSASAAQTSETAAETSRSAAETSEINAATSETSAAASSAAAATSETNAANSASSAGGSASSATSSASAAETSASAAATSASAAEQSSVDATTAQSAAQSAATASASSASAASASETAAGQSATSAQTARTSAETAAANASTSEGNAASSETSAQGSAASAASSETAAANSATDAGNSSSAAATSATEAATSATESETSASASEQSSINAATSETNAASSATAASSSASSAAASETAAGQSANAASSSETAAATSASNAANSETSAATSETNAAGSASSATSSASSAASSAGSAGSSASAAANSATQAATSATDAGVSSSAAAASAVNASTAQELSEAATREARPSTFESGGKYFTSSTLSPPETAANADANSSIEAGSDADGYFLKINDPDKQPSIFQKFGVSYNPGDKYRVSVRLKSLTGTPSRVILRGRRLSGDYATSLGTDGLIVTETATTTATDYVFEFSATQALYDTGVRILKAEVEANPLEEQTVAIYKLDIENITAQSEAEDSAAASASSASSAAASETAAGQSANAAQTSETAASTSAANASASEGNAATSETNAAGSSSAAAASESVAATAAANASTSETNAAASETSAASSASAAASSASSASASETAAGQFSNAASSSETAASTSAANAAASSSSAATSATNAAGSASAASSSQTLSAAAADAAEAAVVDTLPSTFENPDAYFSHNLGGAPSAMPSLTGGSNWEAITDPTEGPGVAVTPGETGDWLSQKGVLPALPGHTYRLTARIKETATPTNDRVQVRMWRLDASYSTLGQAAKTATLILNSVEEVTHEFTLSTGHYNSGARFIRAALSVNLLSNGSNDGLWEIYMLKLEDITDLKTLEATVNSNATVSANNTTSIASLSNTVTAQGNSLSGLSASASATQTAVDDIEQGLLASIGFRVKAGTSGAEFELSALDGGDISGSVARISAAAIILDGTLSAAHFADGSIFNIAEEDIALSAYLSPSTEYTVLSKAFTSAGGKVRFDINIGGHLGNTGGPSVSDMHSQTRQLVCKLYRDNVFIGNYFSGTFSTVYDDVADKYVKNGIETISFIATDNPAAGTYTYDIRLIETVIIENTISGNNVGDPRINISSGYAYITEFND